MHAMSGPLGEHRFIGRLDAGSRPARPPRSGPRGGTPAASAPGKRCARNRLATMTSAPLRLATRFTVSRAGRAAIAAPCSTAASIEREIRSDDTNGRAASCTRITSDSGTTRSKALATESCRRDPPATTRTAIGRRHPIRRRGGQRRRKHDDDVVDAIVAGKRGDAALEDRSAADVEQLLRHGRAEPAAFAGSRDDGGYMHGKDRGAAIKRCIIAHARHEPAPVDGSSASRRITVANLLGRIRAHVRA